MLDPSTILPNDQRWQCQRCGNCCKWPGDVRVDDEEIAKIAAFLDMDVNDFMNEYVRLRSDRQGLSLIEKPNDECIFFEDGGCVINPVKPIQCAGFPNTWNYIGWRNDCEAIAVFKKDGQPVNPRP
ncbi:YkgJ family cysteine cluster protein [Sulfuriroseicoccus oceanibius]|uniref:YkgJ family cysteine cluster protein n=1 Tax=Sulfuriroseicoccus oceanibius TaxID=2707525 RepID=A0A6B3L8W7_9BACT|nr:YkgJ family cysteine cluster protein [Sulfuriroseicoccus oceanibius]QQL43914.1 YkgJ family cysteine cluster protein [Sulfuriroseicoccus oceanibius]